MAKATRKSAKSKTGAEEPAERWALPAQQARSRETRAKILAAAERVFAEKGYDGARLQDIAEAAGCSVGAVYFRFKDKDALFFAIAETFAQEGRENLSAVFKGELGNVEDLVRNFVLTTVANFRKHRGMFRAVVEGGFDHPLVMKTIFALRDELARAIESNIAGRIKRPDPGMAIRVMTQMVYGFMLVGVLNKSAPTKLDDALAVEELANAAVAYLLSERDAS
jgi:AcrR family transcriptional regulator